MPRGNIRPQQEPLDEEERQLIRELEAGEWISNPDFVVTDEFVETASALEATADELKRAKAGPYRWKWAILALHSAVQGMMALALRGGNNLRVLNPKDAERFLGAVESGEPCPSDLQMDNFLSLYKKIKSDDMLFCVNSKKFAPQGTQGQSVRRLNRLRNRFIHFTPCTCSAPDQDRPFLGSKTAPENRLARRRTPYIFELREESFLANEEDA